MSGPIIFPLHNYHTIPKKKGLVKTTKPFKIKWGWRCQWRIKNVPSWRSKSVPLGLKNIGYLLIRFVVVEPVGPVENRVFGFPQGPQANSFVFLVIFPIFSFCFVSGDNFHHSFQGCGHGEWSDPAKLLWVSQNWIFRPSPKGRLLVRMTEPCS